MKLVNVTKGARAVLMRDRSYVLLDAGEAIELDGDDVAAVPAGLAIDGEVLADGRRLADLDPLPVFRSRRRQPVLPPPPPSLVRKAAPRARRRRKARKP